MGLRLLVSFIYEGKKITYTYTSVFSKGDKKIYLKCTFWKDVEVI